MGHGELTVSIEHWLPTDVRPVRHRQRAQSQR